ncbi:hypothetical protein N0V85_009275, partial [Neurospora sp. IMI 360204]
TNTSEETDNSKTTATAPDSPTTQYSSPDNVYEYQAMAGFTVRLSAKKPTGITFDPISQPGDNIHYDKALLVEETPSPSPGRCRSQSSNTSTSSNDSYDMSTPYDFSKYEGELEMVAILERPGEGRRYAKMSCGNWYWLNEDGTLDELSWPEYRELIAFIVGDVASLPAKLHQTALHEAAKLQNEKEPIATVEKENSQEVQGSDNATENVTENTAMEITEDVIDSDQPDEKWFKAEDIPANWFVMEHVRCPGDEISYYAEYVRGSDDMWYFRLDGPEYRPLDARELRWFLHWRHTTHPMTTIIEVEEDEFF